MIKVENVTKIFNGKTVLDNVSTLFENGKCNLIIGKSGSGKTVLMKCLVGLHTPDEGYIHFDDRILRHLSKAEKVNLRKDIGMLFQGGALFDSMNVEENIMFPIRMFQKSDYKTMRKRVDFCLDRVNLSGINKMMPSELSGGMQKRVAIARAIATQPKYLFCDEPNSGLDPLTSIVIDKLIMEITHEYNITTVVNTHDMNSVMEIGENINFISQGKLWWKGNNQNILSTDNKELQDFIFCSALTKKLQQK